MPSVANHSSNEHTTAESSDRERDSILLVVLRRIENTILFNVLE